MLIPSRQKHTQVVFMQICFEYFFPSAIRVGTGGSVRGNKFNLISADDSYALPSVCPQHCATSPPTPTLLNNISFRKKVCIAAYFYGRRKYLMEMASSQAEVPISKLRGTQDEGGKRVPLGHGQGLKCHINVWSVTLTTTRSQGQRNSQWQHS